jgi:DNA-binding transcriptional regulator LsrR (DeoR family)
MTEKDAKALIEEMQAVKKLLVLQLLGVGFKQRQIASMLGISEASMSRMLPKGLLAAGIKTSAKGKVRAIGEEQDG